MSAYYNEVEPFAADWLENLIAAGLIAPGVVDRRDIRDVRPDDLRGYTQCHFFAGIGIWSYALRQAGWPDDRSVWTGSCPCFPAGTLVLTEEGLTPIDQVRVGQRVWTHKGRWCEVVKVGSEVKPVGDLVGQGHFGLTTTADHPFYARTRRIQSTHENGHPIRRHIVSDSQWRPAVDMPGHWWAMPQRYPHYPRPTLGGVSETDVAFISGLYVGDGWAGRGSRSGRIILGVNEQKADEILDRLPHLDFRRSRQRTGVRLEIKLPALARHLTEHFGERSAGKRLPAWLLSAPAEVQRAFVEGWDLTDGTRAETTGCRRVTTTSRDLAVAGRMLFVVMGYAVSIRKVVTRNTTTIEGREVRQRDYYVLSRSKNTRYRFEAEGMSWFKVKRFEPSGSPQQVYNIEVQNDHSYTADGIVVHNCQPFSAAGRRGGVADERHLWPHWNHLIGECRPPKVFGEQVASKDGLAWVDLVSADLEGAGYAFGASDLCAAGFGPSIEQTEFGRRLVGEAEWFARRETDPARKAVWWEFADYLRALTVGGFHIRQRLYFTAERVADADDTGPQGRRERGHGPDQRASRASGVAGGLADADGRHPGAEREQRGGEQRQQPEDGGAGRLADADRRQRDRIAEHDRDERHRTQGRRVERDGEPPRSGEAGRPGPTNGFWRDVDWLFCRDGKWRPVEPSAFPLVTQTPSRVGRLRAYGNSLDLETAVAFIEADLERDQGGLAPRDGETDLDDLSDLL